MNHVKSNRLFYVFNIKKCKFPLRLPNNLNRITPRNNDFDKHFFYSK